MYGSAREPMFGAAVLGTVGQAGAEINVLDFPISVLETRVTLL
jgi:hypothetical protein